MKPTRKLPTDLAPILAFGAHPDDIEFGCGGVIARETQAGRAAHFVVCSRGEAGTNGTPAQRTAEARKGAARLGATLEFVDLGGDAHLQASVARALKLAAIIRRLRPAVVLAPTPVGNQHPDHAAVGRMVRDAARLARYGGVRDLKRQPVHAIQQLLFYAVTVEAEPADRSAVLIDVTSVAATWWEAMQAHQSQAGTREYAGLQMARAAMHGQRAGVGFAIPLFPNDTLVFGSVQQLGRAARQF
jgi:LmbE family N-acetylglucosaminyl deacetylase